MSEYFLIQAMTVMKYHLYHPLRTDHNWSHLRFLCFGRQMTPGIRGCQGEDRSVDRLHSHHHLPLGSETRFAQLVNHFWQNSQNQWGRQVKDTSQSYRSPNLQNSGFCDHMGGKIAQPRIPHVIGYFSPTLWEKHRQSPESFPCFSESTVTMPWGEPWLVWRSQAAWNCTMRVGWLRFLI